MTSRVLLWDLETSGQAGVRGAGGRGRRGAGRDGGTEGDSNNNGPAATSGEQVGFAGI